MVRKTLAATVIGLALLSSSAYAIEGSVDASKHSTNLNLGLGTTSQGLFMKGNWLRSDDDGSVFGLGLGYNIDVGDLRIAPTVKALYTHPENGRDGFSLAGGAGAEYSFTKLLSLYGEYYYGAKSLSDRLHSYKETGAGLSLTPVSLLNLRIGYKYVELNNKGQRKDNVLVDGPYLGASLRF